MNNLSFKAYIKSIEMIGEVVNLDLVNEVALINVLGNKGFTEEYNFDEIILMQHSGLEDLDGVKIYDGDILEFKYEDNPITRSAVRWYGDRDYPAFDLDYHYLQDHYFEGNALSEITSTGMHYYKVIGNIYTDKELLE